MSKNAAIFLEKYSSHLRHIKAYNLAQPYQDSFFRLYRLSFQNSQPFQKETVKILVRWALLEVWTGVEHVTSFEYLVHVLAV